MIMTIMMAALFAANSLLSPNHSIDLAATVVDDEGKPMHGVTVEVLRFHDPSLIHAPIPFAGKVKGEYLSLQTDVMGNFSLSGRGISYTISLHKPG
jgi:hypothetical protein